MSPRKMLTSCSLVMKPHKFLQGRGTSVWLTSQSNQAAKTIFDCILTIVLSDFIVITLLGLKNTPHLIAFIEGGFITSMKEGVAHL